MQSRTGRRLTLLFGVLLVLFGVVEVVTHRDDTAAAIAFWSLSLLGGGTLVLAGVRVWPARPGPALALVVIGTLAGLSATVWTLVMPLLGIAVVVLAIRDASARSSGGAGRQPLEPGPPADVVSP